MKDVRQELELFAAEIRLHTVRQIVKRGFGHLGGTLSMADLVAALYGNIMKYDPDHSNTENRDWLVCSKGHAGPAIYAALALKGFFPIEELDTLNQNGTLLPSHCDKNLTNGIDMTTGSLGQGISTAIGVALGKSLRGLGNYVYLVLGDGELNEGQVWEGAMFAAAYRVGNLIAFVDWNKKQLDGFTKDVLDIGEIAPKWESFGWHTQIVNGQDVMAIIDAVKQAKEHTEKPSVIVLDTIKGAGCETVEKASANHHMQLSREEGEIILTQMNEAFAKKKGEQK